jgi:hypothetical protein
MPEAPQWARVRGDVNCHVRRGAWYEVIRLMPEAAVLDVHQRLLNVDRSVLQIVPVRPRQWSIVALPRDAVDIPLGWGSRYAVCPGCSTRAALPGQPPELQCPKCHGMFPVAWHDPY